MRRLLLIAWLLITPVVMSGSVAVLATTPPTHEGGVAISPVDSRIVIAAAIESSPDGPAVRAFRSTDGGQTWTRSASLPMNVGTRALTQSWDPVVAIDRGGVAYLSVIGATATSSWTVIVYHSTDDGATWAGVDVTPAAGRADKPWIAIDLSSGPYGGSVYAVWHSLSSPGGLQFSRSRDGGETWSNPKTFSTSGWPFIAVSPAGRIFVSFVTNDFAYGIVSSNDGGETFSSSSTIAPMRPAGGSDMPGTTAHQIAADRNNVYAMIPASNDKGTAGAAVYFTRSADGGITWSAPKKFSTDTADAALPSITVDSSTDELVISWLDRRDDPSNKSARVFSTRSVDGGITLDAPRAFTPSFIANNALGDYNQVAAQNGKRLAVFADGAGTFSATSLDFDPKQPPVPPAKRRAARH